MIKWFGSGAVALGVWITSESLAQACEHPSRALEEGAYVRPWMRIGCNTLDAFSHENLALQLATIPISGELSASGADHRVRVYFARNVASQPFSDAMVLFGYLAIPASALLLYGGGHLLHDRKATAAGAAAIQALAVTFLSTSLLKIATGRPYPNHGGNPRDPDRLSHPGWSKEWEGPVLANRAWPSGHTATTMALVSSLAAFYGETRWLAYALYPVAGAVGLGMLSGEHHWLSDVAAGAVLGHTIGSTVGSNFREIVNGQTERSRLRVTPGPGEIGASVVGIW
jgi:membrane-associated phospholipid phosphatase